MIRKILLIFLVFVCATTVYSQNNFEPTWNVGVGFGPTFSSVDFAESSSGSGAIKTNNKMQYHGGLAVRYITEKHLGFILELNYSQQGWEENFSQNDDLKAINAAHSHTLNYLELPFLTHIYWGNKVRFVINLGPKIGLLISESEEMSQSLSDYLADGVPNTMATHQYYRNADKKIDYGILAGLGLEFQTGIGSFLLEGRYYFGLGDIYNNTKSDYFSRSSNQVISAKLTYYVKLF